MDLDQYNFARAEAAYLVANTPLYICRSLKSDPTVVRISASFSADEIVREIDQRLANPPATPRDRIIPFILLGALAVRQDRAAMSEVAKLNSHHFRWFKPVLESLIATTAPLSRTTMQSLGISKPTDSRSSASSAFQKLEAAN